MSEEIERPETEESSEKSASRLTPAQWAAMAEVYEIGDTSMADLAKIYGVSISAISQKFKRDGVQRGAKKGLVAAKVLERAVEKASESPSTFAAQKRLRVEETKNQSYEWSTAIAKLTMKTVIDAQKKGVAFSTIAGDMKALRFASAIIAQTRQERFAVLDIDNDIDEKDLPSIEIRNLTEDEIETLRSTDPDELLEVTGLEEDDDIVEESGS